MTALAMVLGMLPMALAVGEGSEQNAPLGRAVIGGLLFATLMTLFVVPAVYSTFSGRFKGKRERDAEIASVTLPPRDPRLRNFRWTSREPTRL
jgi:AcrB/AcrD/AcrF family